MVWKTRFLCNSFCCWTKPNFYINFLIVFNDKNETLNKCISLAKVALYYRIKISELYLGFVFVFVFVLYAHQEVVMIKSKAKAH